MNGRVAITGADGFVGASLERLLTERGRAVARLVRRPSRSGDVPFRLGDAPDPGSLAGVDALVHCAYDFRPREWDELARVNVRGSERLFAAARAAGVRRLVFVSSVSAFETCVSTYGRGKLVVEEAALKSGGAVVRPGLVWDASGRGMFGALARLSALPVLPVFDGGRQPLVLVHADDLARALADAVDAKDAERLPVLAAHPRALAFREILERLAAARARTPRFVSAPGALGLAGLRTLEALGVPLRFRRDSLLSLLNPDPAPDFSAAERLGWEFRDFRDARPEDVPR